MKTIWTALHVLEVEAAQEDEAVKSAEQSVNLELERYKGGVDSYLNVITTQTIALTDERTAVTILQRRMVAAVTLITALGGGWNAANLPNSDQLHKPGRDRTHSDRRQERTIRTRKGIRTQMNAGFTCVLV